MSNISLTALMCDSDKPSKPICVPHEHLTNEALSGVLMEIVSRDGTELTDAEVKIAQVRKQLESGEYVLVFDPEDESLSLLRYKDWQAFNATEE